jgi:hypothetical protein
MSIIHHDRPDPGAPHHEAEPRATSAPTDASDTLGQPETREDHDSTAEPAGTSGERWYRRRFLKYLVGTAALLAVPGVGVVIAHDATSGDTVAGQQGGNSVSAAPPSPNVITASPEQHLPRGDFNTVPRVFDKELTRDQIRPPQTLNPNTYAEAFANVGQALQFYVNTNDQEGIKKLLPGIHNGYSEQPEAFEYRAAYFGEFRQRQELNHQGDPENNPANFAWGFAVKIIPDEAGQVPTGNIMHAHSVSAKVQITVGAYRPSFDGVNSAVTRLEKPRQFTADMYLSRYKSAATGETRPDNGWMITDIANISSTSLNIPPVMTDQMPNGFTEIPEARIQIG